MSTSPGNQPHHSGKYREPLEKICEKRKWQFQSDRNIWTAIQSQ
jgi:hypothetical protein